MLGPAVLLGLDTPQSILIVLSFTAMSVSVGVAVWLWLQQRARTTVRRSERSSAPVTAAAPSREAVGPPSVPAPSEPVEIAEPTEIVAAFPFLEQRQPPERTQIVAPPPERTQIVAPPPERTQIVAPPPERMAGFEKTDIIPSPLGRRAAVSPKPIPAPVPEAKPARTEIDLPEHLRLAIEAFEQLQAGTPTPALTGHLDVLGGVPAAALLELVRPTLAREHGNRFAGALLTLLHSKTWPAKTAFPSLLTELDEARRRIALALLRSWDDPRAEAIAVASLAAATDIDSRVLWLDCFAERGWDPGAAVIEAALAEPDPRIIAQGLRLLPRCEAALHLKPKLAGSLFASDPAVRMQAIEAALAFGDQSAWLVCRQLARNPAFPGAAQLVGLLGTESEIAEQCRAFESAPTSQLLAGLGLSGRAVVLRACTARFDDPDLELRKTARAALTLAAGSTFESTESARKWLDAQTHPRLLAGTRRSPAQVITALRTTDEPTRRALARELRIRSKGQLHVDPTLLPHAFAQQLERLQPRLTEIDFERGFPW